MTQVKHADDNHKGEPSGPSLAFPPIYLVRTGDCCPACGDILHVFTLGCAAYHDREDSRPVEEFHFLRRIESVPASVLTALLTAQCNGYFFDWELGKTGRRYLMNHCRCGARLNDDYLHGEVGAAFWPDTPDGFAALSLFRLPYDEAIPIVAAYIIGGGEYLDIDNARPW